MIPGAWLDAVAWGSAAAALASAGASLWSLRAAPAGAVAAPATGAAAAEGPAKPAGLLGAGERGESLALRAALAAFAGVLALFLFLASRFLAADLSYQYVFYYTSTDLDLAWRLAGTWAGREGSLLLWTVLLAATAVAVAAAHRRRPALDAAERSARAWTQAILGIACAAFMAGVATQSPFTATSENLLRALATGNGLNPTLKSGYILIHPPLMFAAYALATVPAAAALGHLASGNGRWSRVAMPWSRLGWLLMTFALGLGALWAYYTLGFGGYWAWDPVEVANLLPWLAFTVYLHAQVQHDRHGTFAGLGPALGVLPLLLVLFSTISTRSGLWVSVHAFTDPTEAFNPDAAGRFLGILEAEPSLAFPVAVFLAVAGATLALSCLMASRTAGRMHAYARAAAALFAAFAGYAALAPASAFSALLEVAEATGSAGLGLLGLTFAACLAAALPLLAAPGAPSPHGPHGPRSAFGAQDTRKPRKPRAGLARIHTQSLAAYSVLALGLALVVLFLFHVASAQRGATAAFYETRFPYLALPVLLGLIVFQGHQAIGRRRSVLLALAVLAVAAAAWGAARADGSYRLAQGLLLGVPATALAWLSFVRVRRAATPSGTPRNLRRADALLLLAALLNLLFWLNPPTVRLGPLEWTPVWPTQAVLGAVALACLGLAARTAAGVPPRRLALLHVAVGLLGGFYVAPALALGSWLLRRRHGSRRDPERARARLHQVAVHGLHFAIAVALVGYAPSTYLKSQQEAEFPAGQAVEVAGTRVLYTGEAGTGAGPTSPAGLPLAEVAPRFEVGPSGEPLAGQWTWEPRAGSHYPLPATVRSWTGDVFLDVAAVHVAPGGPCLPPGQEGAWVEAYKAGVPSRLCAGDRIDAVRANVATLPGLGLLWLALALGVGSMALLMATGRARTA